MADWNFNNLTQSSGGILAKAGTPLAGFVWEKQSTEHVVYIGYEDNHIHELYYNGKWWSNDLTKAANGAPYGGSNIVAFAFENQNTEHVFYAGTDGHVHELYYNGKWWSNDLMKAATGNPPNVKSYLAGFAWENKNTEHVFYVGTDNSQIHELLYDGKTWHHNNLTSLAGNPPAWKTGKIAAYVWENNNTKHVAYVGTDGHIHELYYDGQWHHSDLTNVSGGPTNISSNLTGFAWENKNSEHVFYEAFPAGAGSPQIHELWYDTAHPTWHDSNLSADPARPPLPLTDNFVGYAWESNNTEHVMYSPTQGAIQELWHNSKWSTSDIWARSVGAPFPRSGGELAAYAWEKQNSEHVIYVDGNGNICELYYFPPSPPTPPVPPVISVTCTPHGQFTITGRGFLPNSPVYVKVIQGDSQSNYKPVYGPAQTGTSKSDGTYSVQGLNIACDKGANLHFSAEDGRPNQQDPTGLLWSNTFDIKCC